MDGFLSDQVWSKAIPFSNFLMVEPNPGCELSEKTELQVLYDETNLYIGIYCYDKEPEKIAANSLAHDQTGKATGENNTLLSFDVNYASSRFASDKNI
ncbi:MAG: hypothetical protein N3B16_03960 [Candidatus Aminicenantes bacterium]|nr:hypothetical protein [Candidatus Aminicenantes bacterium]